MFISYFYFQQKKLSYHIRAKPHEFIKYLISPLYLFSLFFFNFEIIVKKIPQEIRELVSFC